MENGSICTQCGSDKGYLICGLCQVALCKSCARLSDPEQFDFHPKLPGAVSHPAYCNDCFDAQVAPFAAEYADLMEKAENLRVYFKNQSQETRLLKRRAPQIKIADCPDYRETILRLAYLAALSGHNAIVDLDLASKKVKEGSRQTTVWTGTALPIELDEKTMAREVPQISNPN